MDLYIAHKAPQFLKSTTSSPVHCVMVVSKIEDKQIRNRP
jgi:hypothetical protein